MTGQDFQDNLDAIVLDLQTNGRGQTVNIMFRSANNQPNVLPLSSDSAGGVNPEQLGAVQSVVDGLKANADSFENTYAPVKGASAAYSAARVSHQTLIDDAKMSRDALTAALTADANYQSAKTAYDTAKNAPAYMAARDRYKATNVSENYAELTQAKGSYVATIQPPPPRDSQPI